MKSVFDIYTDVFNTGDFETFRESMSSIGNDIPKDIQILNRGKDYIDTVMTIAKYLEIYGIDYNFSQPMYSSKNITSTLNVELNYMRMLVNEDDVEKMLKLMLDHKHFPEIVHGSEISFTGKFITTLYLDSIDIDALMIDALTVYLYGFPIRREWISEIYKSLRDIYVRAESISQAFLYIGMCTNWLSKVLCEMSSFNITANEWCSLFDNILFDLSKQNINSFVAFLNPRDNSTVVCVSKIYLGKYFVASRRIFNILYENELLDKIRFTDRLVPVRIISDGSNRLEERTMNVPVYYDNKNEEVLVSSIAGEEFAYHEIYIHDVGKGY